MLIKSLLRGIGGAVAGLFRRDVITVNADTGEESTARKTRPFPVALGVVMGFALVWHFIIWPILNTHFPEYGFPYLPVELLTTLIPLGM